MDDTSLILIIREVVGIMLMGWFDVEVVLGNGRGNRVWDIVWGIRQIVGFLENVLAGAEYHFR